jgi:Flp pilus assembly protein TadD
MCLAGILGIALSLAYGKENNSLLKDGQWQKGKSYLAVGRAREAKEVLESLVEKYPKEPDLRLFLAISLLKLRDVQAAELSVRKALSLEPDHLEARTLLGWINLEVRRDYASAIEQYARVVALSPESPEAHNNLGVAFRRNGDLEKALETFNRALELRSDYSEAWSNRGWVHVEQKIWLAARSDFEQALRLDPNDEGALYGLSRVLRQIRDYAGAQEALSALIARSPNFVYWLEWAQVQLVRYYWVLLLVAGGFFIYAKYQNLRRRTDGGWNTKAT